MNVMGAVKTRTVFCCILLATLLACATSPTVPREPPADIAVQPSRKLPKSQVEMHTDWYPAHAKSRGMQGRVLVEFRIDRNGRAISEKVLAADAPSLLQDSAFDLVKSSVFDVSEPGIDLTDPTPFRVTVLFCLSPCGKMVSFPGTDLITIAGSPLPQGY
jgi:TonB family protein